MNEYKPIKPLVIAIEGMDGSGKSTLVRQLYRHYREKKNIATHVLSRKRYHLTRYIAHLVDVSSPIDPVTYMHLTAAGCMKAKRIKSGITILDRFVDTFRVRAMLFGVPEKVVNQAFSHHFKPHLTIVMKLPVEHAIERKNGKISSIEMGSPKLFKGSRFKSFEEFQRAFQTKLLALAKKEPDRYLIVNADQPMEKTLSEVVERIDAMIQPKQIDKITNVG